MVSLDLKLALQLYLDLTADKLQRIEVLGF
ncbi:hypothetical protein EMIT0P171_100169 [Pseudomonas sp. IT-P171]